MVQIQRSAKLAAMGCTRAYCPLQTYFVSGSRCAVITSKLLALYFDLLVTLDNIANLDIVVRLDVKTAILTYGNLLHIVLEAAE
jgi:hypothetical protein